jgi:superfamily II DNA or RNA helicase
MPTKFFNNSSGKTLFEKISGIKEHMASLHSFHAVVGYFRSSGYFKVREVLGDLPKIQILIGINIDDIFRGRNKAMLFMMGDKERKAAWEKYRENFIEDVQQAGYARDIEQGIIQLADDMLSGRVELRVHATKDLHAKFYLFLPKLHNEHSDGWVIMGSSNLSESGLGITKTPRYELNVAMKDFEDVSFCKSEFDRLWAEALPLKHADIESFKKATHLGQIPTPYQLYMKLLIDFFGTQAEDDFSITLPDEFMDLKYQRDAVSQGYQMLLKYNGFFLADVVGLGKTVVATMIAKRFIEENGTRSTRILVIFPPAVEKNWLETFEKFKIRKYADFLTNGSIEKIHQGRGGYRPAEDYDLILVDEAHGFRSDTAQMYDSLQRLCKTDRRSDHIRVGDRRKKVMLISATPLNNYPSDLYNLILLFQDKNLCNIEGVPSLQNEFAPWIKAYKNLTSTKRKTLDIAAVRALYDSIRVRVLEKITVRRTRSNIEKYPEYKKDLDEQGVVFPEIEKPKKIGYLMSPSLEALFVSAVHILTEKITYARYRAVFALCEAIRNEKYPNAEQAARSLEMIFRTFMVKRLESSFVAFKASLSNFRKATQDMVDMFDRNQVIIAPDLKIGELLSQGKTFEEIIEKGKLKYGMEEADFVFPADSFDPAFIGQLKGDIALLDDMIAAWKQVDEDPKMEEFLTHAESSFFTKSQNPSGKLVIFSESKDTARHIENAIKTRLNRQDALYISSDNRDDQFEVIRANFDASIDKEKRRDDINILITTDVLSEGVNLHRANVIINYDTPWNAVRMMQRIGRVNRIGSVAGKIYNYMFYPSAQGDAQINLYKNHLAKLQGFHSALGEDSQIYSLEEIVESFELFNPKVADETDKALALLREIREFYAHNPEEYNFIKCLPVKSRTGRSIVSSGKPIQNTTTLVYVSSDFKKEFYRVEGETVADLGFLEAAELFRAAVAELPVALPELHYSHVTLAQQSFDSELAETEDDATGDASTRDKLTNMSRGVLRAISRESSSSKVQNACESLLVYVERGTFAHLTRDLAKLETVYRRQKTSLDEAEDKILELFEKYHTMELETDRKAADTSTPRIIISETFV